MMKITRDYILFIAFWSFRSPWRTKFSAFPINIEFESKSKYFLKKFYKFSNDDFRTETRSLSLLRAKNYYESPTIKDCLCRSRYIGEHTRNSNVGWNEHNNPTITL